MPDPQTMPEPGAARRFQGLVYRALNPIWVDDPLSGEGARRFGGRFNPRGMAALYTSLDPVTALREVSQIGQPLQPTVLVSYRADLGPVFDGGDPAALAGERLTPADLAAQDWRLKMAAGDEPATQRLARRLSEKGFVGMLAPSYARLAAADARNLILWNWREGLQLVDDEERLNRTPSR